MRRAFQFLLVAVLSSIAACSSVQSGHGLQTRSSKSDGQNVPQVELSELSRVASGFARLMVSTSSFTGSWSLSSRTTPFSEAERESGFYDFATNEGTSSSTPAAFVLVYQLGSAYVEYEPAGASSRIWKGMVLQAAPASAVTLSSFEYDVLTANPGITAAIIDNGMSNIVDKGSIALAGRQVEHYALTVNFESVLQHSSSEESLLVNQVALTAMRHSSEVTSDVYLDASGDVVQWSIDLPGTDLGTSTFTISGLYTGTATVHEPASVQYLQGYAPPTGSDLKQHDGDAS